MYGWLKVSGQLKSFKDRQPFHVYLQVLGDVPGQMVVDYLHHYLDAGTHEELELNPIRFSIPNLACAALTYRYLRPHGRMLVEYWTDLLEEQPAQLGPQLFADELIEVWGLPGSSDRPESVFG